MDEKEFNETITENNVETLETTKEIQTLKDLSITAINNIENEYQEDFDDNMEDADLIFKSQTDTIEEKEPEHNKESEETKKENIFKKLWNKWLGLDKKKKIIILVCIFLVLILLGVGLYFLLRKDSEPSIEEEPPIVLEMGSYRYENGNLVFTKDDEEIGRYECENKDETLCAMAPLTNDDDFSGTKKVDQDGNPLELISNVYFDRYVFIVDHKDENDKSIKVYDLK